MPASGFTTVNRLGADLCDSISSLEKRAKAAAAAPYTVDRGFPSARPARPERKFQSQRKTRCNRGNYWSSKLFLDQSLHGKKGNAFWPTIFRL